MNIYILLVFGILTILWLWMLADAARSKLSDGSKIAWIAIIFFTYIFGAALYFFFGRIKDGKTAVLNLFLIPFGFFILSQTSCKTLPPAPVNPNAPREHTYEWEGHTGTANVWFRVDNRNCTVERVRCELSGWTSVGLYWASIECVDGPIVEEPCKLANGDPGVRKCLTTTVILKNAIGADIPFVGQVQVSSWEEGRTTFTECTDCCPIG